MGFEISILLFIHAELLLLCSFNYLLETRANPTFRHLLFIAVSIIYDELLACCISCENILVKIFVKSITHPRGTFLDNSSPWWFLDHWCIQDWMAWNWMQVPSAFALRLGWILLSEYLSLIMNSLRTSNGLRGFLALKFSSCFWMVVIRLSI